MDEDIGDRVETDRPLHWSVLREESRPSITLAGENNCIKWGSDRNCKEFSNITLF